MTSCSTRSPLWLVRTHCTSTVPPTVYWGCRSTWVGGPGGGVDVNMSEWDRNGILMLHGVKRCSVNETRVHTIDSVWETVQMKCKTPPLSCRKGHLLLPGPLLLPAGPPGWPPLEHALPLLAAEPLQPWQDWARIDAFEAKISALKFVSAYCKLPLQAITSLH